MYVHLLHRGTQRKVILKENCPKCVAQSQSRHRCDVVFFSSDFMRARAKELESEGEGDHHAAMRGLQALAAKAKAKHVAWHFYKKDLARL